MKQLYDIIDAEKQHFPAIRDLFVRELSSEGVPCWSADEDDYPLMALPDDEGRALVMLDGEGNAVAYGAYHEAFEPVEHLPWQCAGKAIYLHRLLIDSRARGKGLARRMTEALAERARALGGVCCRFVVYPQNEHAVAVYEKMGLPCIGEAESPWAEYGDGGVILLYEVQI